LGFDLEMVLPVRMCPRMRTPGWPTWATLLLCFVGFVLDACCLLPHPVGLPSGSRSPQPGERGLAANEIRRHYKKRLHLWSDHVAAMRRDNSTAIRDLANAQVVAGVLPEESRLDECRLAHASVVERTEARISSRLMGSAGSHFLFILRDLLVYRSFTPFNFAVLLEEKRKRLKKNGSSATTREACDELVRSATRSNRGYDDTAEALGGIGYVLETFVLYVVAAAVIVVLVYACETMFFWGRKDNTD